MTDDGIVTVSTGPLRACTGGGTACLADGEPLAMQLMTTGRSVPSVGTMRLRSLTVLGVATGSSRAVTLRPRGDGGFDVAAVSPSLAIEPGLNTFAPMIPVNDGDTVALTDVRSLAFDAGEPWMDGALTPIGAVGTTVDLISIPKRGQLVHRTILETDRDGDGVVDSVDACNGPSTGAVCPVTMGLQAAGRPEAVTAGQPAWFEVRMQVTGPPRGTQPMVALVDIDVTPGDASVRLPGECSEVGRDASAVHLRCRGSYVTSALGFGTRPAYALQATSGHPGGEITARVSLHSLGLRDAPWPAPLTAVPTPATARVPVRGYDAFRARVALLRSRSPRSLRLAVTCPGGWMLTSCPLALRVTGPGHRAAIAPRTLRLTPGARRLLTVALRPDARRRFARDGRLPVRISLTRGEVGGRTVREVVTAIARRG